MALYLVESVLQGKVGSEQDVKGLQENLAKDNLNLIDAQISKDLVRGFFVVESEERDLITKSFRELGIPVALIKPVRLVGKDLEDVKKNADRVNYLVEWNLPEGITMDQYIDRKTKGSVHYAEVPEVAFSRTYVCEDMTKCLCFYDAPDEEAVKRARQAVKAPIDTVTEVSQSLI